jgi:spermidine synthase
MIADAAALFLTGFVSLVGQIVLLRELNVAFYGIELIYLIALGLWLLLAALGTLAGGGRGSPGRTAALFLLFSLFLPLCIVFLRASRILFGGVPGAYLPFPHQMAALAISLLPAACLSGFLFGTAAGHYARRGGTLAGAYGIESLGGLAGGLAATICLKFGIQNFALALACGATAAAATLLLFPGERRPRRLAALGAALLSAVLLWQAPSLDRAMTRWSHPDLLATRDSPYGRITVTNRAGQVSVFENDALAFESEGAEAELFAHMAALQHPRPRAILVLGGGLDGTVRELLKHRPSRIDAVELDRVMVGMVRSHLPRDIQASLADPVVRLRAADPRRFLKETGSAYDLLLVGVPEPSSGQANRFYTREFFQECAGRLAPGGILALRLSSAENFWTPQLIRRTASIHRALAAVFPETLLLPGTTTVITASGAPLPRSPEIPAERLRERGIATRLVSPPYIRYLFTNDRRFSLERLLKGAAAPMNTDTRPACYPYAVMIWLSKFFPKLALVEMPGLGTQEGGYGKAPWLIIPGLALLFLLSRRLPSWRRRLLVAAAAFVGIVLEAVIILVYQAREGVLYQDIGLLLMAFMAGLALGVWILNEALRRTGVRKLSTRRWGIILVAGLCLLGAAMNWYVGGALPVGLLPAAAFLAAGGFFVAGILAYAGLSGIRHQSEIVIPLYAADLLGGCLGSLLGSLVLIPLFGLDGTVMGMIFLSALLLILL